MRIFITGGTGFIGSNFVQLAQQSGHEILALRREDSKPRIPLDNQPVWLEGDMTHDWLTELESCDALVHLAAYGVNPSDANWNLCFSVNVTNAISLWLQANQAGIKNFTICGSCFEYGNAAERYDFIPPDAALEPTGPYHSSKAAASMAAIGMAVDLNLKITLIRPFHVFGEGEHPNRLWPSMRKAALSGEDFPMTLGEQIRDFISVEEFAATLLATVENPPSAGSPRVMNAGTGVPQSTRSFAEHWWKKWNASGELLIGALSYRPNEVMRYVPQINSPVIR